MNRAMLRIATNGFGAIAFAVAALLAPPPANASPQIGGTLPSVTFLNSARRAADTPVQEPQSVSPAPAQIQAPTQPWWVAAGRKCDGCPPRRPGRAFFQTTVVNVFYGLGNLARGHDTAKVTPKTWWSNMHQGWVWDLNDFVVNQFGHPYQGSNYFNSGRANGLSFWESAAVTAFGSATWEYFGETNPASLNDFINTTMGGIALGEMFHRAAWLVRDPERASLGREIGAMAIDPLTGFNRFMTGDARQKSAKPAELVPSSVGATNSFGVLRQRSDTPGEPDVIRPFVEMDLRYGDMNTGRSRTPYEAFLVRFRFGGGAGISDARVRGRLLGQPIGKHVQLIVSQSYDYTRNAAYSFGAQGIEANLVVPARLSDKVTIRFTGWGGATVLGAVDSRSAEVSQPIENPDEPQQRRYDYGPGSTAGGAATLFVAGRSIASLTYEGRHIHVADGVRANHFLHWTRADLRLPLTKQTAVGVLGEYFVRTTHFQDAGQMTQSFHFPQIAIVFIWSPS